MHLHRQSFPGFNAVILPPYTPPPASSGVLLCPTDGKTSRCMWCLGGVRRP
ncbi:hypothetical protein KCP73_22500 [Salmonella enterica subsp. enterica]|nr:hypothetical protein KCP73_22500 [Salmonella enterica subsp. enterica]